MRLSAALLLLTCVHAADKLTLDQAIDHRELSDLQFSPDGKHVAFCVQEPPTATKTAQRHIWMFDTDTRTLRQWTNSTKTEHTPRWSPDGTTLAFLSDREENTQIWTMAANGGEAIKLTTGKNAIEAFRWSRDGKQIAFLAAEPRSAEEEKKQKDQDDARVVDVDRKPTRVWIVDIASKAAKKITSGTWNFHDLDWIDGKRLLAIGTEHPADERRGLERLTSIDVEGGAIEPIHAPRGPFGRIRVSPGGSTVAFVGSPEDGPEAHDLFTLPISARQSKNLTGTMKDRPVLGFQWMNDADFAVLFQNGFHTELVATGGTQRWLVSDDSLDVSTFAVSPQGKVVYVAESAVTPQELWADGKVVSHFNDGLKAAALERPELFRYQSFDGTQIESALFRGSGASRETAQPLVVMVHGGPTGAWRNRFDGLTQLLVARGYSVMQPNIRGSLGYGHKFVTANKGDWGGGDFKDVMAGVDDLVKRKIADPNRLAIAGWSYGGYMAEWAITQTGRFKAAIAGAGMSDLATEFGTEAGPAYDEWFFGTPYENLAGFQKSSPIVYIKNARTPTLILQGENDTTDPISQSQMLYRGLKRYNVPAEFVVYPREPHGLRERNHIADRYRRSLDWIEKYLGK